MSGMSTKGNVVATGKMMARQANANMRSGPGRKNLGPSASRQGNPASTVRATGQQVRGPDKGAGGM